MFRKINRRNFCTSLVNLLNCTHRTNFFLWNLFHFWSIVVWGRCQTSMNARIKNRQNYWCEKLAFLKQKSVKNINQKLKKKRRNKWKYSAKNFSFLRSRCKITILTAITGDQPLKANVVWVDNFLFDYFVRHSLIRNQT